MLWGKVSFVRCVNSYLIQASVKEYEYGKGKIYFRKQDHSYQTE